MLRGRRSKASIFLANMITMFWDLATVEALARLRLSPAFYAVALLAALSVRWHLLFRSFNPYAKGEPGEGILFPEVSNDSARLLLDLVYIAFWLLRYCWGFVLLPLTCLWKAYSALGSEMEVFLAVTYLLASTLVHLIVFHDACKGIVMIQTGDSFRGPRVTTFKRGSKEFRGNLLLFFIIAYFFGTLPLTASLFPKFWANFISP